MKNAISVVLILLFTVCTYASTVIELADGKDQEYIAALVQEPAVVGDIREGGVVFWVDPADNTHGLVCAFSDYATPLEWGCYEKDLLSVPNVPFNGREPVGDGAEIGDGMFNTNGILSTTDCPDAPAALAARSLGPEWFLPSIDELKEMFNNKETLEAVPEFSEFSKFYWSSTEGDDEVVWGLLFKRGKRLSSSKISISDVRAIRAF